MRIEPRQPGAIPSINADAMPRPARTATTPRLAAIPAGSAQSLARPAVADVHLPERHVRERATAIAERTRTLGAGHSLRVWRDAHREAITELAREACGVATGVRCEALYWEREGDWYHVSATFAPVVRTIH